MKIELLYVLVGLIVGLMITYFTSGPPKVILKYPNPENTENTKYIDQNGVCYRYRAEKTSCDMK